MLVKGSHSNTRFCFNLGGSNASPVCVLPRLNVFIKSIQSRHFPEHNYKWLYVDWLYVRVTETRCILQSQLYLHLPLRNPHNTALLNTI